MRIENEFNEKSGVPPLPPQLTLCSCFGTLFTALCEVFIQSNPNQPQFSVHLISFSFFMSYDFVSIIVLVTFQRLKRSLWSN